MEFSQLVCVCVCVEQVVVGFLINVGGEKGQEEGKEQQQEDLGPLGSGAAAAATAGL